MMLGTAKGRFCITPERVAINMDHFDIPDNAGNQPQGSPIISDGPVGYFSSLPVDTLVTRLKEAHIPAAISNTAGLYLCNQLFYSVMHCITANQMSTRAGFIHLPYLDEQTVNEKQPFPGMSRETMMKAVHIAIETLGAGIKSRKIAQPLLTKDHHNKLVSTTSLLRLGNMETSRRSFLKASALFAGGTLVLAKNTR